MLFRRSADEAPKATTVKLKRKSPSSLCGRRWERTIRRPMKQRTPSNKSLNNSAFFSLHNQIDELIVWHRLASRHRALLRLGKVNCPEDVPNFARDLSVFHSTCLNPHPWFLVWTFSARKSVEEQRNVVAELDHWAATHADEDNSSEWKVLELWFLWALGAIESLRSWLHSRVTFSFHHVRVEEQNVENEK